MRALLLLGLTGLIAAPCIAQVRTEDRVWLQWRDSVSLLGAGEVQALLAATDTAAGTSSDRRLRRAFLEVRSGELAHARQYLDAALADFCAVASSRPGWWLPQYGIGVTQRALAKGQFFVRPADCHTEGTSYTQDAGLMLARALEADSSATVAAETLADVVASDPSWGLGSVARTALRRFAASGRTQPPGVLIVRIALERHGGARDSVLPLIRAYLAAGGDPGVGLLEMAREKFFLGDSSAADDYWAGVAKARSGGARAILRNQLTLVARPGEMAGFGETTGDSLVAWVRAFWTRRDVEAGLPAGSRLAEHYSRYEVAWRGFRPVVLGMAGTTVSAAYRMAQSTLNGSTPSGDSSSSAQSREATDGVDVPTLDHDQSLLLSPESGSEVFDVRGQVYMRHGPPDDKAGPLWVYRRDGQEFVIRVNDRYPGSPCSIAAKYCKYEMAGRRPPPEVQRKWETEWQESFASLERFDTQARHFGHDLHVSARLYSFPQTEDQGSGLVVALAIPAAKLQPEATSAGLAYRVHLHLIVSPPAGTFRIDRDTTRTFVVSGPLGPGAFLQVIEPVSVDPGGYTARLIITGADTTVGAVLAADSLELGDGTAGLVLSDLIFSRSSTTLAWHRGTESIPMDPLGQVPRRESLRLYYEVAGRKPGVEYASKVELFQGTVDRRRPDLALAFKDRAEKSTSLVHREFGLDRLKPGNYVVQVTVEGAGRKVVRRAPVVVTE